MAITITIHDTLILDQSAGLQDDDVAIAADLTGLSSAFRTFLLGLAGDLTLSGAQLAYADTVEAAISGPGYVTVDAGGAAVTDLFFSDPDGNAFDGDQVIYNGSPLQTVGGDFIYLWSQGDGDIVLATTSATLGAGDVVAAFYLNDAADSLSASIEMVTFIALAHPNTGSTDETVNWSDLLNVSAAGSTSFDFDALKSGSSLWVAVGSADGGVLVTGGHPVVNNATGKMTNASDVIHTSQGGDGTTIGINNQLFDNAGETGVFTLVKGLDTLTSSAGATGVYIADPNPNDTKPEGIDYDEYLNVTGAGIYISQSQGSPSVTKSFDVNLYSAGGGTTPEEGFGYISGLASDALVNVGTVTVVNDDGEVVGVWNAGNSGSSFHSSSANGETDVTIEISGNHIEVDGVFGQFTVSWTSLNDVEFNRFTLVSESGQFDVGRVDITSGLVVTEPVGDTMFVDDDGPSLPPATQDVLELITDDTGVTDSDTLSTDLIFTGAPVFGTDGPNATDPIQYSLRIAGLDPDPDSGLVDTETGRAILLKQVGADIIGYVDANGDGTLQAGETTQAIKFSLSGNDPLDSDTETVTFTQYRAVVHDDITDPDESTSPETVNGGLVFIDQTAIDGDGDVSGVSSFDLGAVTQLRDDGPSIDPAIDDGLVDFAAGDSVTNPLNGNVGKDPNSSPYTITSFTAAITTNGIDLHGILSDGDTKVTYWADTGNNGTFGDAGDTAYYTMELGDQGGSGDYTFTVLLDPPPASTEFNFGGLHSGNNLFAMVADEATGEDNGLIVIGKSGADITTSQGGGPTTIGVNSQMFDPGEGAYFTFVADPNLAYTAPNLSPTEADAAANIQYSGGTVEGDSAFIEISQLQSNKAPSLSITLFNIDDSPQGGSFVSAAGTNAAGKDPDVTAVQVYAADGVTLLESYAAGVEAGLSSSITISIINGVATVAGFSNGYTIAWDGDENFDQVLIQGVAGKFDVGGFGASQDTATPDQKLDFTATVTDGDGDFVSDSWSIGIDGTGIYDDNNVLGVVII
jgi:hypothetical protein